MNELLAPIVADPTDLGARMVYGDALAETGDPRGELVNLQCALANAGIERVEDLIDAEVDVKELGRLATIQRRTQQLAWQFGAEWLAPLGLPEHVTVRFRRGMPESITAGQGVDVAPLVERLARHTPIGELVCHRGSNAGGLDALDVSYAGLRVLDLTACKISFDAIERIVARASVRRLAITWLDMTAQKLDRLIRWPKLRELRFLELRGHEVGIAPIQRLLEAHPDLVIGLRHCKLDDKSVDKLVEKAPEIRGIDVRENPLSIAALRMLVALPRLRYLGFDPAREVKHDKGTVGKAVAKATAPLRSLALGGSVNGVGLKAIAAASQLAIRAIDLHNDRPGDIGPAGNLAIASMRELVMLKLRGESIEVGIQLKGLPTLAYFDSSYIDTRARQKQLALHYGDCIRSYRENKPSFHSKALQRRIEVPAPDVSIRAVLETIAGISATPDGADVLVRDPKVNADPIGVTLKKLPNKPRYITLWYWEEDAKAWAARLDEIAAAFVKACNGTDIDTVKPEARRAKRR